MSLLLKPKMAMLVFGLLLVLSPSVFSAESTSALPYSMKNSEMPMDNLITGGQPTIEDLKKMAEEGVTLVINLRTDGEFEEFNEQKAVTELGMRYLHIPVNGAKGVDKSNAELLHRALNSATGKTLLHCASSNRVGGLLAARAYLYQDFSAADAFSLGKKGGMKSTERSLKKIIASTKN